MIYCKTEEEIELMRESSLLVGKTLAEVAKHLRPGVKTVELDAIAEQFIHDNGAVPSFKNYNGYPKSLCISVNSEVVHGIPGDYEVKEGDVVSVDCGVYKNGFHGDSAFTFAVGQVGENVQQLLKVTRECLEKAIEMAVFGKRMGDLSYAVQHHAESNGFSVVRELVGHGIGKDLHESPEVPNYGVRGKGVKLQDGMVIAIEPMINMGTKEVKQMSDNWTIKTADNKPSAHFEHTVAIRKGKADVLSSFEWIEKVLNEQKK
jgi:methionyl aminopeptidase